MNDAESHCDRQTNTDAFQYGLSTLHAWIRLFECVIHVGYRLKLKVWTVRKHMRKEFMSDKLRIQKEFRDKIGQVVDMPCAQWRIQGRAMGAMPPPFLPNRQSAAPAGAQEVFATCHKYDANLDTETPCS